MIPKSRISSKSHVSFGFSCALLLVAGCGSTTPAMFPTGEDGAKGMRRPDGVIIDPASDPPAPHDRADSVDGLVTLSTPLSADVAIETVRSLFRHVVAESSDGLQELFTANARAVSASPGYYGQPGEPWLWWEQRFRRLDYTQLSGETLFRESEIEIYRASDDLDSPPHPALRTEALDETDVILRLTMTAGTTGIDRLFGDQIFFWLRREGDTYKIYREMEDFQLQ